MPVGLALMVVVVGRAIVVRGLIATLWPRRRAESPVI
jgi:hypothetical protein